MPEVCLFDWLSWYVAESALQGLFWPKKMEGRHIWADWQTESEKSHLNWQSVLVSVRRLMEWLICSGLRPLSQIWGRFEGIGGSVVDYELVHMYPPFCRVAHIIYNFLLSYSFFLFCRCLLHPQSFACLASKAAHAITRSIIWLDRKYYCT